MRHPLLTAALFLALAAAPPTAAAAEPAPPAAEPAPEAAPAPEVPTEAPVDAPTVAPAPEPPVVAPAPPRATRRAYHEPRPPAPAAPVTLSSFPFELSVAPETHVATSASLTALSDTASHLSATVRVGYAVLPGLDLYAGYRRLERLTRLDADGADWQTDLHTTLIGARLRYPLVGAWLKLFAQLDLEANYAELRLGLGGRTGRQSRWSAGVLPEAGLEGSFALDDDVAFVARLGVGFALRLDHRFDAVAIATDAPAERPLDLGAANFSGLVVGLTAAIRF